MHLAVEQRWLDELSIRQPVNLHIWWPNDVALKDGRIPSLDCYVFSGSGDSELYRSSCCSFKNKQTNKKKAGSSRKKSSTQPNPDQKVLYYSPLTSTLHSTCLVPRSLWSLQTYSPASDLWAVLILISQVPSAVSRTAKRPPAFTAALSFSLGQRKAVLTIIYVAVFWGVCICGLVWTEEIKQRSHHDTVGLGCPRIFAAITTSWPSITAWSQGDTFKWSNHG